MIRTFFRRCAYLLVVLLLAWAGTGLYFFLDDGPWPARAAVAPSHVFEKEVNCFHGGGYDEWMAQLRAMNGHWNPLGWILANRFPRAAYERARDAVDCRFMRYESDGLPIGGVMMMPKDAGDARLPVLIVNRGGNGSYGALTFAAALWMMAPYAEQGFLVLGSQYRGAQDAEPGKYGVDEFGGKDVRDVERLVELAHRLPNADTDNIFMLGWSRGAMMNYLVARRSDRIRAMASINGVEDMEQELAFRPEMERVYEGRIPDYAQRKSEVLAERSVSRWVEELPRTMPILLLHGGRDDRVDPQNGPRLKARLDAIGHPSKLVVYPEDDHALRRNREQAEAEVVSWFREHAKAPASDAASAAAAAAPQAPAPAAGTATGAGAD